MRDHKSICADVIPGGVEHNIRFPSRHEALGNRNTPADFSFREMNYE